MRERTDVNFVKEGIWSWNTKSKIVISFLFEEVEEIQVNKESQEPITQRPVQDKSDLQKVQGKITMHEESLVNLRDD